MTAFLVFSYWPVPMKRDDPKLVGQMQGEAGLWAAVLLNVLNELEAPRNRDGLEQSRRIITDPDNSCLFLIAAALGLETGDLQGKIIRYLKKKRVTI